MVTEVLFLPAVGSATTLSLLFGTATAFAFRERGRQFIRIYGAWLTIHAALVLATVYHSDVVDDLSGPWFEALGAEVTALEGADAANFAEARLYLEDWIPATWNEQARWPPGPHGSHWCMRPGFPSYAWHRANGCPAGATARRRTLAATDHTTALHDQLRRVDSGAHAGPAGGSRRSNRSERAMAIDRDRIDRFLGKLFFRAVGMVCFIAALLLAAEAAWILLRHGEWFGIFWLAGAGMFAAIGFYCFGKNRRLSEADFH